MNDDHVDSGALLCQRALGDRATVTATTMRHVDRFGCEYVARIGDELAVVRLGFAEPAASMEDVRRLVVDLVRGSRQP